MCRIPLNMKKSIYHKKLYKILLSHILFSICYETLIKSFFIYKTLYAFYSE